MTATDSVAATDTWSAQFEQLKARYKHVRPPILAALQILITNPEIALDDAKAEANRHGVRITAATMSAAQRLFSRMDEAPAPATKPVAAAPQRPARRVRPTDTQFDAEALVRGFVAKIQGHGSAEAERMRAAMRKAIAVLQAAVR